MLEKIKLKYPVVVEGKYDKNTLSQIIDGVIITTGGFAVFNSKEKQSLIKKLGSDGIILLTDSDGGGVQIRKFLHGTLRPELVFDAYIPKIKGKEARKKAPSKSGLLGVEGVGREAIVRALSPFIADEKTEKKSKKDTKMITKVDLFLDGLSGKENSAVKRARLLERAGLPADMSANAMLAAFNLLYSYDEYKTMVTSYPTE